MLQKQKTKTQRFQNNSHSKSMPKIYIRLIADHVLHLKWPFDVMLKICKQIEYRKKKRIRKRISNTDDNRIQIAYSHSTICE